MAPGGRILRGIPVSIRLTWCALAFAGLLVLSGSRGSGTRIASAPSTDGPETLRAAAQRHHLLMGAVADPDLLSEKLYASTLKTEYSELEAENEMKFGPIHPEPETYNFANADKLVAFA